MVDKAVLTRNFSRHARLYDRYADVQQAVAERLAGLLPQEIPGPILEIGCGTGIYTVMLRRMFSSSAMTAIDLSPESIAIATEKAGDVAFAVCDGESARIEGRYGLITSNAVFQWFSDLECALERYRAMLMDGGSIVFSAFGPRTFFELDACLSELPEARAISSRSFRDKACLKSILDRLFRHSSVEEMTIEQEHSSLGELLNKIRYTGTRGSGARGRSAWGRERMAALEGLYLKRYGRIVVSYQIFLCRAGS